VQEKILMTEEYVAVGQLGDFPPGAKKKVRAGDEDVLVVNIAGTLCAISDVCTHRGCSLSEGAVEAMEVTCPCHSGRFDLLTGKVTAPPPRKDAATYDVRIEGSNVLVKRR